MKFRPEQWIAWIAATATAAVTIAAYAFATFETKEHAQETKADIVRAMYERHAEILDRLRAIDAKLPGDPYRPNQIERASTH